MRSAVPLLVVLAASAAAVLVPHHGREAESVRPRTLGGVYARNLSDLPDRWTAERLTLLAALVAGMAATAFPVAFVLLARWHPPAAGRAGGLWYVVGGVVALAGAAANWAMVLLAHTTFAFGGRPVPRDVVAFAWAVAVAQAIVAVAGVAVGTSAACASLVAGPPGDP